MVDKKMVVEAFERVIAEILNDTDSEYMVSDFNLVPYEEKFIATSGLKDLFNQQN